MKVLSIGEDSAKKFTVLFLHGFPGAIGERNIDLAKAVSQEAGAQCFLPHYQGLGESAGKFSFAQCVGETISFTENFFSKSKFRRVSLVGHSWGGFVALNLMSRFPTFFHRAILLSPLLQIPKDDQIKRLVPSLLADNKAVLLAQTEEALATDFRSTREKYDPLASITKPLQEKITILQASQDDEIPANLNRLLATTHLPRARFLEVDQDHRFQKDRQAIRSLLIKEIRA